MDNKLNYDKLLEQLNRIHDKWQDFRINIQRRERDHPLGISYVDTLRLLEDFANDMLIIFENAQEPKDE